jgi:hypothetical protein
MNSYIVPEWQFSFLRSKADKMCKL